MEKTERLGAYRIDYQLSQSSTTSVYKAYEESLKRPVLIKKLHPQMAREEDIRNRFAREAQACAQVNHENIVSIYAYYSEPEMTMLVMEYVHGSSLAEIISKHGALDWKIALTILHYILKGLAFAHAQGVIHRDIKPDNILISSHGHVKLSDFGLATVEDAPKLTMQGTIVGTPAYMPPEQISGEQVDQRSDLFSLGATFYEVLTGMAPFRSESFSETIRLVLNEQPQKPSAVFPEIPAELDQIILRMLDKKPVKRYATAEQALEDVKRLGSQLDVVFDQKVIHQYLDSGSAESGERVVRQGGTSSIIYQQKRKVPLWAYPVIIVVLIFVVGYFLMRTMGDGDGVSTDQQVATAKNIDEIAAPIKVETEIESGDKGELKLSPDDNARTRSLPVQPDIKPRNLRSEDQSSGIDERDLTIDQHQSALDKNSKSLDDHEISIENGSLTINSKPWASVSIDGRRYGETPLTEPIELSPGVHQVVLVNDQLPAPVVESITVEPGEGTSLDVDLMMHFGQIRILSVRPWAEIYLDGTYIGQTPYAKPIIVTFESHEIQLRNERFKTWRKQLDINQENRDVEISAILDPLDETPEDGG